MQNYQSGGEARDAITAQAALASMPLLEEQENVQEDKMAGKCTSTMENCFAEVSRIFAGLTQGIDSELEEALEQLPPYILVSTDSFGGREFDLVDDGSAVAIQEAGWGEEDESHPKKWLLMELDIRRVKFTSWTSGCSLEAVRNENGLWDVTLTVPIDDEGVLYKGLYWSKFWGISLGRGEEGGPGFGGSPSESDPRPEEVAPPPCEEPPAHIARVEEEDEEV